MTIVVADAEAANFFPLSHAGLEGDIETVGILDLKKRQGRKNEFEKMSRSFEQRSRPPGNSTIMTKYLQKQRPRLGICLADSVLLFLPVISGRMIMPNDFRGIN